MNKITIIGAITVVIVVVSCAAGGAVFAIKMGNSNGDNIQTNVNIKVEEVKQESKEGWKQENGSWYFYKNNEKKTEWAEDNNSWYYLGSDGKMRIGWIKDKDQWYYLNGDGTMATNTTVDGCYLNNDGLIEETPTKSKQNVNESQSTSTEVKLSVQDAINLIEQEDYEYVAEAIRKGCTIEYNSGNVSNMLTTYNAPAEEAYLFTLEDDTVWCAYIVSVYSHKVYKCGEATTFIYLIKEGKLIQRYKGPNYIQKNDWLLNSGVNGSYKGN